MAVGTKWGPITYGTSSTLVVSASCEKCGKVFSHEDRKVGVSVQALGDVYSACAERLAKVQAATVEKLTQQNLFNPKPCPHCGYLQSWMIGGAKRQLAHRVHDIVLFMTPVLGLILHGWNGLFIGLIAGVPLSFLSEPFASALYDPNHGQHVAATHKPNIIFR